MAKAKCLTFISSKLVVTTPLEQSLHIVKCQKQTKTPYQTMSFLYRHSRKTLLPYLFKTQAYQILSLLIPLCKLPSHSRLDLGPTRYLLTPNFPSNLLGLMDDFFPALTPPNSFIHNETNY